MNLFLYVTVLRFKDILINFLKDKYIVGCCYCETFNPDSPIKSKKIHPSSISDPISLAVTCNLSQFHPRFHPKFHSDKPQIHSNLFSYFNFNS